MQSLGEHTDKCGVAWMNWGTKRDGYTRPRWTMQILRNLSTSASPTFRQAVQNITSPAAVKQVIGDYLPTVTCTTASRFAQQGRRRADRANDDRSPPGSS